MPLFDDAVCDLLARGVKRVTLQVLQIQPGSRFEAIEPGTGSVIYHFMTIAGKPEP